MWKIIALESLCLGVCCVVKLRTSLFVCFFLFFFELGCFWWQQISVAKLDSFAIMG